MGGEGEGEMRGSQVVTPRLNNKIQAFSEIFLCGWSYDEEDNDADHGLALCAQQHDGKKGIWRWKVLAKAPERERTARACTMH